MPDSPNGALPSWPYDDFGTPLRDPDIGVIDPVVRMDMDYGQKSRERFVNPLLRGTFSVLLNNDQYLHFQSWHKHKLANGSKWFNFKVRVGDELLWQEVKMVAMYDAMPQHNRYVQVRFPLIQRTDDIPDESALDTWLT